jgi:assimilatory nitrate reductase catalytic subunit
VESCIFVAPTPELPSREWLASLFDKESLDESERGALLRGQPPAGQQDIGPIVCACFSVGRNTLIDCIRSQQAGSVEAIGKALRAGTNCGSCIPELKTLLALQKKV